MYNLKWKNESTRYLDYQKQEDNNQLLFIDNVLITEEIIEEAYEDGFINWSVYRKARDRIRTVLNGSWMFERTDK
jgi:hypothetical protein